ncbi:hypothetical protein Y1Q_0008066 [Alligator mississippiensis]|uniref:Uncharacterized protein n=1 Tax=Alligator mississippiensis TaxID=8496 RepID=A0A151NFD0_ALLMI|nr:hypothetical protein Y1Q_0008066 [Alligator mississippiensis]
MNNYRPPMIIVKALTLDSGPSYNNLATDSHKHWLRGRREQRECYYSPVVALNKYRKSWAGQRGAFERCLILVTELM